MQIVAISDLHGHLPPIPRCDLLLLAGDLCPVGIHTVEAQQQFLDEELRSWLEMIPARHVVGIAGNHDWIFERAPDTVPADLRWYYLQDSAVTLEGLTIYGTPWQPRFCDWAFSLDEPELAETWKLIPDQTDILITHGPPHGIGDRTRNGIHTGSPSLLERIFQVQPRLTVFGHIHEAHGQYVLPSTRHPPTILLANVAHMNDRFSPVHDPMCFEI